MVASEIQKISQDIQDQYTQSTLMSLHRIAFKLGCDPAYTQRCNGIHNR